MEAQNPNLKPGLPLDLETEVSGPLNTNMDQSTPSTKHEHDSDAILGSVPKFSGSLDHPIGVEVQDNHQSHTGPMQAGNTPNDWTVEDVFTVQQETNAAFLDDIRRISSTERLNLAKMVQSESQNGMDRICNYFKGLAAQPVQSPTASTITELRAQLKTEKNNLQKLSGDYSNQVQHSHKQKQILEKLNAKLDDALRERDQLRQLLDGGSLANSHKATDDSIHGKWKELSYNIRCLARHLAQNSPQQQLDDVARERLRFISRDYYTLLEDDDYRELILMSYLWVTVQDNVFDARRTVWGGPELKSFKAVRDSIITRVGDGINIPNCDDPIAHAARWLAQGSAMMGSLWERDDRGFRRLVLAEAKLLRPFYSTHQSMADRCDRKIIDQLRDILNSAIEVDEMMMRSKAIFQVHWRDRSQSPKSAARWNENAMDSVASTKVVSPRSRVVFFISPVVYKTGTADGQRYDSQMVLAKASVVCD
ncbi:uncharacterized protein FTJAE_5357 [Fusarium tjaetaba]|uniref:Uncharacterized protein n=1 Tax=Fusarium tjaetaba TaxID=1567544 RepID=A0A8H5RU92_9HYPO|nr:uncharacterized protein FTJAE_5357 [Fusarium tjaetaba]KAF5638256.1 hypothetical protein FTJAE_5357 [Fusarium tjaetaba]